MQRVSEVGDKLSSGMLEQTAKEQMKQARERVSADVGWTQVSRKAMFNYRLKFKGIKYPSPDPTFPVKDFLLRISVPPLPRGPSRCFAHSLGRCSTRTCWEYKTTS